jgi:hypothetical protein
MNLERNIIYLLKNTVRRSPNRETPAPFAKALFRNPDYPLWTIAIKQGGFEGFCVLLVIPG